MDLKKSSRRSGGNSFQFVAVEEKIVGDRGTEGTYCTYVKRFFLLVRKIAKASERKRLVINFDSYGKIGKHLQTYGRKGGAVIPDGLSGTHSMYNERWKFEIKHENDQSFEENGKVCVCITWKIINLTTGKVHTATETKKEAVFRMLNGRTISSRLFKEALDHRARELEEELSSTDSSNELRIKNLKAKIRHLKPKRFSEGTLTFGLQHEAVQTYVMAKQER